MILSHHARVLQLFGYLAHLQKKTKICDFLSSSFDLCTGIILKQLNKINKLNICFFFHFSFFSVVSCLFSRCASLLWSLLSYPVVHPTAAPQGRTAEATGNCSLSFSTNARALAQNAHPDSLHWDHRPGGHHGETQRGDTTGKQNGETKRETKWKNENEKK